jgi:hypothetical protein
MLVCLYTKWLPNFVGPSKAMKIHIFYAFWVVDCPLVQNFAKLHCKIVSNHCCQILLIVPSSLWQNCSTDLLGSWIHLIITLDTVNLLSIAPCCKPKGYTQGSQQWNNQKEIDNRIFLYTWSLFFHDSNGNDIHTGLLAYS